MAINGPALGAAGVGLVLVWSGIRGKKVSDVLRTVISGKNPTALPQYDPISIPNLSTGGDSGGTGGVGIGPNSSIASAFVRYVGVVPYRWAGANPHGWDCSGSCNYVICHDLRRNIPGYKGGSFTGATHGPNTLVWLGWTGKTAISRRNVSSGDLIIWQTHMGIAVNNTHYASAYDTQDGTCIKPIRGGGPIGEVATYWRLK